MRRAKVELLLATFLMLFVELVRIRWAGYVFERSPATLPLTTRRDLARRPKA